MLQDDDDDEVVDELIEGAPSVVAADKFEPADAEVEVALMECVSSVSRGRFFSRFGV